jgi:hypothetical protein
MFNGFTGWVDINTDRLRLIGNGVYPATAALAYVTLDARFRK